MAFKSERERFIKLSSVSISLVLITILITSPGTRRRIYIIFSPSCVRQKQAVFSNKLRDRIVDYSEMAKLSGIKACRDESEIMERAKEGKLVHVSSGRAYITDRLTYSYPYVTKDAKLLLDEIGKRFREKTGNAGLKGSKFIITSMTRTTEKMKGLRKNNSNASANSPHLNGNAFDISYLRFISRKFFITQCDKRYFKEVLAEIIVELKEEGKCWATYEKVQSCFHVVAR